MEKLRDRSCADFSALLASAAAVPGGGGAAALTGSLAVALCAMASRLTAGRRKYADRSATLEEITARADELRERLLTLIDEDAENFAPLAAAYSLPKSDPAYEEALRRATLRACEAPLEMLRCCAAAVELLERARMLSSPLLLSDVGCGAIAAKAALEAAAMNVFINTRSLPGDGEALLLERKAEALLSEYMPRARKIADSVMESLRRRNDG